MLINARTMMIDIMINKYGLRSISDIAYSFYSKRVEQEGLLSLLEKKPIYFGPFFSVYNEVAQILTFPKNIHSDWFMYLFRRYLDSCKEYDCIGNFKFHINGLDLEEKMDINQISDLEKQELEKFVYDMSSYSNEIFFENLLLIICYMLEFFQGNSDHISFKDQDKLILLESGNIWGEMKHSKHVNENYSLYQYKEYELLRYFTNNKIIEKLFICHFLTNGVDKLSSIYISNVYSRVHSFLGFNDLYLTVLETIKHLIVLLDKYLSIGSFDENSQEIKEIIDYNINLLSCDKELDKTIFSQKTNPLALKRIDIMKKLEKRRPLVLSKNHICIRDKKIMNLSASEQIFKYISSQLFKYARIDDGPNSSSYFYLLNEFINDNNNILTSCNINDCSVEDLSNNLELVLESRNNMWNNYIIAQEEPYQCREK